MGTGGLPDDFVLPICRGGGVPSKSCLDPPSIKINQVFMNLGVNISRIDLTFKVRLLVVTQTTFGTNTPSIF